MDDTITKLFDKFKTEDNRYNELNRRLKIHDKQTVLVKQL